MSFNVDAKPKFRRTVTVLVPHDDGVREETLTATFNALTTTEVDAFDIATADGTKELLRGIVVRLEDMVDGDNKPVAHSKELFESLIDRVWVRNALATTYFNEVSKAREGN